MRVPPRFYLIIEGSSFRASERNTITKALAHLLTELLIGSEVPESSFRAYGMRVMVEPDTDGGPEEPMIEDGEYRAR